ncbi:MAG: alpha/beta fold hydrolase [bacterium]|nr:alpha/beta fold hydrolase [bacterium]
MDCRPIRFSTPKKFQLDGLWFFTPKSRQAIIFIHGLGGAMFWPNLVYKLADRRTSVLAFNNRGHDKISGARRLDKKGKMHRILAGSAHEIFTDCVDDIQGAVNFCRQKGFKKIILVGHSTGCQKSIYYLAKAKQPEQIAKVILLCPISDYADAIKFNQPAVKRAEKIARGLVRDGKKHRLLPPQVWPDLHDAQRFLSLFTPESKEEIFCYATPSRRPATLQKTAVPMLLIFAEKDEHLDRPLIEIIKWFEENLINKNVSIKTIRGANHNFSGHEPAVINVIGEAVAEA